MVVNIAAKMTSLIYTLPLEILNLVFEQVLEEGVFCDETMKDFAAIRLTCTLFNKQVFLAINRFGNTAFDALLTPISYPLIQLELALAISKTFANQCKTIPQPYNENRKPSSSSWYSEIQLDASQIHNFIKNEFEQVERVHNALIEKKEQLLYYNAIRFADFVSRMKNVNGIVFLSQEQVNNQISSPFLTQHSRWLCYGYKNYVLTEALKRPFSTQTHLFLDLVVKRLPSLEKLRFSSWQLLEKHSQYLPNWTNIVELNIEARAFYHSGFSKTIRLSSVVRLALIFAAEFPTNFEIQDHDSFWFSPTIFESFPNLEMLAFGSSCEVIDDARFVVGVYKQFKALIHKINPLPSLTRVDFHAIDMPGGFWYYDAKCDWQIPHNDHDGKAVHAELAEKMPFVIGHNLGDYFYKQYLEKKETQKLKKMKL